MWSAQSLTIFYSVCGALVAVMLFRIWRKGQSKYQVPEIPPAPKMRGAIHDVAAESILKKTSVRTPPIRTLVPPAHDFIKAPVTQSVSESAVSASRPPGKNISSAVVVDEVEQNSRWTGRRLLETSGMFSRSPNSMPRIFPEDVPGADCQDRVFGDLLNPAFASLVPDSQQRREEARKDLMSAGFYNPHAMENLSAIRYVSMMLGLILFGTLLLIVPPKFEPFMVAGCLLGPMLGWAFPALYVRSKAKQRKHEIERAMPDMLDMLNMCVGQGLTVPDSLLRIGRDFKPVYPALSQELSIVNEQSKISTLQSALENFSQRIDLPEVHSLTSLLIQTERMGTSISQALTTHSDTMRENQRQQADEKGNRATFRLLFPTVLCLMPAVYLFLLGPAINELQRFFHGGGLDQMNSGSQVVQRINATRSRGQNPASQNTVRDQ